MNENEKYEYKLTMYLVNPDVSADFRLEPYAAVLDRVCPDNVEILSRGVNTLDVCLTSSVPLRVPGRALRTFSVRLADDAEFEKLLWHKHLFRTEPTDAAPASESGEAVKEGMSPEELSDSVFLQALIAHFFKKTDPDAGVYRKKKEAVLQMKRLALEAGMIPGGRGTDKETQN